jgi:heme/copper-type cytochrome/quinol oxidase subunit 3
LAALTFVGLQFVLWSTMLDSGLLPSSGPYASVFFGLTGLHALHVAVGILGLAWVLMQSARRVYAVPRHQTVRLWAMYWHFVGVVWFVMFLTIFLV